MFESSFILTGDMDGVSAGSYYDPLRNGKDAPLALEEVSITEDEEGDEDDDEGDVECSVSIKNPNDRMRLLSSDLMVAMSTRSVTHFSHNTSIQADHVTAEELKVLQEDDDVFLSVAEKQVAVIARRYTVLREVRLRLLSFFFSFFFFFFFCLSNSFVSMDSMICNKILFNI